MPEPVLTLFPVYLCMVELFPVPVEPTQTTQLPSLSGQEEDSDFRKLLRDKLRENLVLEGLLSEVNPIVRGSPNHNQFVVCRIGLGRHLVRSLSYQLLVTQNYSYLMSNSRSTDQLSNSQYELSIVVHVQWAAPNC